MWQPWAGAAIVSAARNGANVSLWSLARAC